MAGDSALWQEAMETERRIDLERELDNLEPNQRAALLLWAHVGLSQREIASLFGVNHRTVGRWIAGAKKKIRGNAPNTPQKAQSM